MNNRTPNYSSLFATCIWGGSVIRNALAWSARCPHRAVGRGYVARCGHISENAQLWAAARVTGRQSETRWRLPAVIELVLSRPIVSAAMIAKAKITPRGALNLVAELDVREMTGRGRYRAWGVI
ncbi:hypothetical protein DUT91_25010 [Phyllobacterium salinisoli]|uniref:HTH DNA binding domain-containing protein n=1 Tax=Phyllobacterium salinisoli TaxID=1899321 RepID=A0A368JYQ3_9HYPH|nr:hypothetical protein DUT91_25010 [Phyllobacterium salinisoli]